jgi:hypothetical protein
LSGSTPFLTRLFLLLLCLVKSGLLIRAALARLDLRPSDTDDPGRARAGMSIGMLERALVFAMVLAGEFGGVGFVVAAKGLVRPCQLEGKGFAEYVLIGTLLSVAIGGGLAMLALAAGA